MGRAVRTSIDTVTKVSIKFVEKETTKQKVGQDYRTTKDAPRATQVERQVKKKVYTHDTD